MARRVKKYRDEGNIWEAEPEYRSRQRDGERPKAPLMLRVLTWGGVILLCFVGGFVGTKWGVAFLDKKDWFVQSGVVKTSEDVSIFDENKNGEDTIQKQNNPNIKKVTVKLTYPKDGALTHDDSFELLSTVKEQEIKETIEKLLFLSNMFSKEVTVKHIFRNASTLYLDVGGPFIPMLSNAGQELSSLFITGIVHTMTDNFPPIKEIRFLVNGSVTTAGSPVDLTATWKLP